MTDQARPALAMTDEELGRVAYEAFWGSFGREGMSLARFPWEGTHPDIQYRWGLAARAVLAAAPPAPPAGEVERLEAALALCAPVECGRNPILPAERVGCGRFIGQEPEVFRCFDCTVPFHRECLKRHCREGRDDELAGVPSLPSEG